tara:strand:- start:443 stop:622 length:180 start_codon:yes stop_codon:yes gene_type:complete
MKFVYPDSGNERITPIFPDFLFHLPDGSGVFEQFERRLKANKSVSVYLSKFENRDRADF